jgi:hypothetical protein
MLKHCPKLQNLTIHEVLFMSMNIFLFTWTLFIIWIDKKLCELLTGFSG